MSQEMVNEVLANDDVDELDAAIADVENEDDVSPGSEAETSQDGRSNKKKRKIYVVPEAKLTYPFAEDVEPWSLDYVKLKEDDFQSVKHFENWECYEYLQARIDKLQEQLQKKLQPLIDAQNVAKIKLEQAEEIAQSMDITDEGQKAALAEALGIMNSATGTGISFEQMLNAFNMLQQSQEAKEAAAG